MSNEVSPSTSSKFPDKPSISKTKIIAHFMPRPDLSNHCTADENAKIYDENLDTWEVGTQQGCQPDS